MARYSAKDIEIERNEDPFEYEMEDGTVFVLVHPKSVRPDSLLNFESLTPKEQVQLAIADGRADEFLHHPEVVDMYYFEAVMTRYNKHYGLGSPGEGRASRRSSKSSARR